METVLLILIFLLILYLIISNKPLSCILGIHNYVYSGEKHGIYLDKSKSKDKIIGTKRNIYHCSCGKQKLAENKDYIK